MSSIDTYQQLVRRLAATPFFRQSAALLLSNVLSMAIALGAYPIITRLYDPATFGEFSYFISLVTLLTILSTARYETAILLPRAEERALALARLCFRLLLVLTLLLSLAVSLWSAPIARLLGHDSLRTLLPWLPALVFLSGLWQTLNSLHIRHKRYYHIATYNVTQNLTSAATKSLLGFGGLLRTGLIWGTLAGLAAGLLATLRHARIPWRQLFHTRPATLRHVARAYATFPAWQLPNDFLNTLTGTLPILLLAAHFPIAQIGLFSLALTVGFRPVHILTHTLYQLLSGRTAERLRQRQPILPPLRRYTITLALVLLPPFVALYLFAPTLFTLLFGLTWQPAALYLRIMLPWLYTLILSSSLAFVPELLLRQRTALLIDIAYITLRIASLFIGIYYHDIYLAAQLYCHTSALLLLIRLLWYRHLLNHHHPA